MNTSFSEDWESFEKAAAEANRLNKAVVFEALSQAGITRVCVGFDGYGDQGQMERATAQTNGKGTEFPSVAVSLWESRYGGTELKAHELPLQEAVEHLCYRCLEERHGGWENNEGSFGEFALDVPARTITLEHYGRIIETAYSSETF
jgi:hypothetical protein